MVLVVELEGVKEERVALVLRAARGLPEGVETAAVARAAWLVAMGLHTLGNQRRSGIANTSCASAKSSVRETLGLARLAAVGCSAHLKRQPW